MGTQNSIRIWAVNHLRMRACTCTHKLPIYTRPAGHDAKKSRAPFQFMNDTRRLLWTPRTPSRSWCTQFVVHVSRWTSDWRVVAVVAHMDESCATTWPCCAVEWRHTRAPRTCDEDIRACAHVLDNTKSAAPRVHTHNNRCACFGQSDRHAQTLAGDFVGGRTISVSALRARRAYDALFDTVNSARALAQYHVRWCVYIFEQLYGCECSWWFECSTTRWNGQNDVCKKTPTLTRNVCVLKRWAYVLAYTFKCQNKLTTVVKIIDADLMRILVSHKIKGIQSIYK